MKRKLLLLTAILFLWASISQAAATKTLQVDLISAEHVGTGSTAISSTLDNNTGINNIAAQIVLVTPVTVTFFTQGSSDGVTFYDLYDSTGSSIGSVSLGTSRILQIPSTGSKYLRFKVTSASESIVTLTIMQKQQ